MLTCFEGKDFDLRDMRLGFYHLLFKVFFRAVHYGVSETVRQ